MLTFENVLEIFHEYLLHDPEEEVLPCKRGYVRLTWNKDSRLSLIHIFAPDWTQTGRTEEGFTVNQYFLDHPEMVLGRPTAESTQYGKQDYLSLIHISPSVLA